MKKLLNSLTFLCFIQLLSAQVIEFETTPTCLDHGTITIEIVPEESEAQYGGFSYPIELLLFMAEGSVQTQYFDLEY